MMTSLKVHFFMMTSSVFFGRFWDSILWSAVRFRAWAMIPSRTFSIVGAFFVEFSTIHIHGTNLHGATLNMVVYDAITMTRGHFDVIMSSMWRNSDVIMGFRLTISMVSDFSEANENAWKFILKKPSSWPPSNGAGEFAPTKSA